MSIVDFLDRYHRTVMADTIYNINNECLCEADARYKAIGELAAELNIEIPDLYDLDEIEPLVQHRGSMVLKDFEFQYKRTVSADTQFNIDTNFLDDQAARYMAIKELADELNIVISDLDSF